MVLELVGNGEFIRDKENAHLSPGVTSNNISARQGGDEIIGAALARIERNTHQMRLFDYWRAKKNGNDVPLWNTFELMDLFQSASFLVVKDVVDSGGDFINRYWGSGMTESIGTDHTDAWLGDYYEDDVIEMIRSLYQLPVETRQALIFSGDMWFLAGRDYVTYSALCVPCANAEGKISQLVTVFEFAEELKGFC